MIPAVAAKESWKPGSHRSVGLQTSSANPARQSAFMSWESRSRSTLRSRRSPITVALSTEGCPPTTKAKPTRTAAATSAVARRGTPNRDREAKTGQEGRRGLRELGADGRHRPAPDPDGPGGRIHRERCHAVAAPAPDEHDPLPAQVGRVIEDVGVPESHRTMEPDFGSDPLALSEGFRLAVDRELHPASRGAPVGAVLIGVHIEQEPRPICRPADRLVEQPPFDGDD